MDQPELSVFGRAALKYAKAEFRVFPCTPRDKSPLGELVPRGHLDATTDEATIRQWWTAVPDANIGLVPGEGFVVIDEDPQNGGDKTYAKLPKAARRLIESSLRQDTGGGGTHTILANAPKDLPGKLGTGIDLKRHGRGYIVASPSIHPNGKRYRWRDGFDPDRIKDWSAAIPYDHQDAADEDSDAEDRQPLTDSQLKNLLKQIPSDDRDTWTMVAACLRKDYPQHFQLFVKWSSKSAKFRGEADCKKTWQSFKNHKGGVGTGTLVHLLKQYGGTLKKPEASEEFDAVEVDPADKKPKAALAVTKFSEIPFEPVDWLVPGYVARGVLHCIAGFGSDGKSSSMSALIAAATHGVSWIDSKPLPAGKITVAMITEEPVKYQTGPRLKLAGADLDRVLNVEGITTGKTDLEPWNLVDHEKKTREFLKAHPEVQLLLIDPIGSYMHGKKREINTWKDSDVRFALTPWQKVAEDFNIAIVYIAHQSKGKTDRAMHQVAGSIAFTTVTRMTYMVVEPPKGYLEKFGYDRDVNSENELSSYRILAPTKVNIGPPPPPAILFFENVPENDNPKVTVEGQMPRMKPELLLAEIAPPKAGEQRKASETDELILDYVAKNPGRTKNAICVAVGVAESGSAARNAFARLEQSGQIRLVQKSRREYWVYPGDGDADLFATEPTE